jgi:outer membrane PBP1 activator LpoA protein
MRLAYFGGPFAAKALIGAQEHLPTAQVEQMHDAALLLHAKFQQAIAMPMNAAQLGEFLQLWADIQIGQQRLQLDREKLSFRMQRWAQRTELRRGAPAADHAPADLQPTQDLAETDTAQATVSRPNALKVIHPPNAA